MADLANGSEVEIRQPGLQRGVLVMEGIPGPPGQDGEDGQDGTNGVGVPTGGAEGQALVKASGANYDTIWVDQASSGGVGELLARTVQTSAFIGSYSVTTTQGDVDATNLSITFTVPDLGMAVVTLTGTATASGLGFWSLRQGSANVAGTEAAVVGSDVARYSHRILLTGLTPGSMQTYKWAARGKSSMTMYYGISSSEFASNADNHGPLVMEVYSA